MPLGTYPDCVKTLTGTVKVRTTYGGPDGTRAQNVFYIQTADDTTDHLVLDGIVASTVNAVVSAGSVLSVMSNDWHLIQCDAEDNSGTSGSRSSVATLATGGIAFPAVNPNTCWVIRWTTTARYRGGHARSYMPGGARGNTDTESGRLWSDVYLAELQTAAVVYKGHLGAASGTFTGGTVGTIHSAAGRACLVPPVFLPFAGASVRERLCSQRRRLGRLV